MSESSRSGKTRLCRAFPGLSQDRCCLQSCSSLHLQLWRQTVLWYQKSQGLPQGWCLSPGQVSQGGTIAMPGWQRTKNKIC